MALTKERENEVLRRLLVIFAKSKSVTLDESKRYIGNLAHETGEKPEIIAEIIGSVYGQAVAQAFNPEHFKKTGH